MRDPVFSEHYMRQLWEHRLYNADGLRTADGQPVTVLSPGVPNYDCGPDFADALIRIGTVLFRGDVEVHVRASEWAAHRHHLDARYNAVILHVAIHAAAFPALTASRRELPLLLLPGTPGAPGSDTLPPLPQHSELSPLHCPSTPAMNQQALVRRLSLLGLKRLEAKRVRFEERLACLEAESTECNAHVSRVLWEQVLYEGVVEGLGYSKNQAPFRSLARSVMLSDLRRIGLCDHEGILAALFGAAGLLPSPRHIAETESRAYVRRLRARWKELHPELRPLHETAWKVFRLRPANLPTARLASLAFLLPQLFGPGAAQEIVSLFHLEGTSRRLQAIRKRFVIRPDDFWAHHLYFGTPQHPYGIAIGQWRMDDIIVNTLLPWILLYAGKFQQPRLEQSALLTYRTFPPLQRNRITRQVERLLTRFPLATAQLHQGALEWERQFCGQGRCALCPVMRQAAETAAGRIQDPSRCYRSP